MSKTIADVATQIAEAVMDAIERRNGIIKDDITEAARGVLAKNQSGSSPYNPYVGMLKKSRSFSEIASRYLETASQKGSAAFEAARHDLIAYGSSVVRVNGDGNVEHVKRADYDILKDAVRTDDGKIWELPNGSP